MREEKQHLITDSLDVEPEFSICGHLKTVYFYSASSDGGLFLDFKHGPTEDNRHHHNIMPHLSVSQPVFVKPEVTLPWWISAKRFHLRTVLWRAGMQALVFHQNANNILCNIQGNIIVVLIGEKNC